MAEEGVSAKEAAAQVATDFMFGKEEPQEEVQEAPVESEDVQDEPQEELAAEEEVQEDIPQEETAEVVEIEVDGELLEVPAKYKDYFMRQADYTQKTQQLSEQRKETEILQSQVRAKAEEFEFAQSVWDDVIKVQNLQTQAEQYTQYLRDNIDSLSSTDIEKMRLAIQDAKDESQTIATQVQQKQQEFQQSQQQAFQELLNKGTEVLRSRIPGWGEDHQKQVRDYALQTGFSEEEINSVVDPRQVEMLWKAKQYDELKKGTAQAVKKVQSAPTIKKVPPRDPQTGQFTNKKNQVKKALKDTKQSPKRAARSLEEYIGGRFNI